jgi:hypothetical protein
MHSENKNIESEDLNVKSDVKQSKLYQRIHVIEGSSFTLFKLVEVDGHEYLSANDGGIVHLESCPCKNR